jgi:PleD family two-component response regulator
MSLMANADEAMYAAKKGGRNRTVCHRLGGPAARLS